MSSVAQDIYSQLQDSFAKASEGRASGKGGGGQGWSPEPGFDGSALMERVDEQEGTFHDGTKYLYLKPVFKIMDGEHEGKTFRRQLKFTTDGKPGGIYELSNLATCLAGSNVTDFNQARELVKGSAGAVVAIRVAANEKYPQYPRFYYNKRLDS